MPATCMLRTTSILSFDVSIPAVWRRLLMLIMNVTSLFVAESQDITIAFRVGLVSWFRVVRKHKAIYCVFSPLQAVSNLHSFQNQYPWSRLSHAQISINVCVPLVSCTSYFPLSEFYVLFVCYCILFF